MTPIESAHEQLLALDLARLPPAVRAALVVQPELSLPVEPEGEGFKVSAWGSTPAAAPHAYFAKLGIKSWRDSGSLRVFYAGLPLRPAIEGLLASPTRAQRAVAGAWTSAGAPLELHLFPYVPFTDISECRWLADPHETRRLGLCERGSSAAHLPGVMAGMQRLAKGVAAAMPPGRRYLVDIACLPDGKLRLVDINPGLSLAEIDALTA